MPRKKAVVMRPCIGDCGKQVKDPQRLCDDPECQQKFMSWVEANHDRVRERLLDKLEETRRLAANKGPLTAKMGELVQFPTFSPEPEIA
jgi:hypothetical protein